MNSFSARKVLDWKVKFTLLLSLWLCGYQQVDAATLRVGLIDQVAPFYQPDDANGILVDEMTILFSGHPPPQLIHFPDAKRALAALRLHHIDMLFASTSPSATLHSSVPLLAFPLGRLRMIEQQSGAILRFPAIPASSLSAEALPGSATVSENVQRMIRGEASQLVAPTFLINDYLSRNPVTTLAAEPMPASMTLYYFAWVLPERQPLIAQLNQRVLELNQDNASWLERKWLLTHDSVFSGRNLPSSENAPRIQVRITLPNAPAPWLHLSSYGEIQGVWVDLLTKLFPSSHYVLTFLLQNHSSPAPVDDVSIDVQVIASQTAPSPDAQPYDALHWGIISPENQPLSGQLDKLINRRLAILRHSSLIPLLHNHLIETNLVPVDTVEQGIALIHAGGAEGLIGETLSLSAALSAEKEQTLRLAPLDLPETPLWFITENSVSMAALRVRQVLASVTQEDIQKSRAPHTATHPDRLLSRTTFWLVTMSVIALCAALLALKSWIAAQIKQRQQEKESMVLHDALSLWQTLGNNAPVPLFVSDPAGRLVRYNETFGHTPFITPLIEEGMLISQLPLGELAQQFALPQRLSLLNYARPVTGETILADGVTTLLWWSCRYTDSQDSPQGIIGGWVDISEKAALGRALNQAVAQAERASEEKSLFLARISHDIRTPLNAVLGLLEIEREHNNALGIAFQAALTLRDLIGDVLELSRIEAGELHLDIAPYSLWQSLHAISTLFASSAEAKGLRWREKLDIEPDHFYLFDNTRLHQIVANLLSNAVKYTAQGEISFDARYADGQLLLTISDSGKGMSPQALSQLGQAWFKVDPETPQSSGLGLTICHQLVTLMAGEMQISSTVERGTKVSVSLPLPRSMEAPVSITPTPPLSLAQRHILVVDDFLPNLTLLRLQLEKLGQRVSCVDSAEAALDFLAHQSVDVLITDCKMPQMDGYTLVQTLLTRDLLGHMKAPATLLGCTANALPREEEFARHAGMHGLLRKPLLVSELQRALSQFDAQSAASPDLSELHALAGNQSEVISLLSQQMRDTISQDLDQLPMLHLTPDSLSALAHRMKASWSLLGMHQAQRACQVVESLPELLAKGIVDEPSIAPLITAFTALMRQSLTLLEAQIARQ